MNDGVNIGAGIGTILSLAENEGCRGCAMVVVKAIFYTILLFGCFYLALQIYIWFAY